MPAERRYSCAAGSRDQAAATQHGLWRCTCSGSTWSARRSVHLGNPGKFIVRKMVIWMMIGLTQIAPLRRPLSMIHFGRAPSWGGRPKRAKTYGKEREHGLDLGDSGLTRGGYVLFPAQGGGLLRAIRAADEFLTSITASFVPREAMPLRCVQCATVHFRTVGPFHPDIFTAYSHIIHGITPPDNQSRDYPQPDDDAASFAELNMAYFRKALSYLGSKGYTDPYPPKAA